MCQVKLHGMVCCNVVYNHLMLSLNFLRKKDSYKQKKRVCHIDEKTGASYIPYTEFLRNIAGKRKIDQCILFISLIYA